MSTTTDWHVAHGFATRGVTADSAKCSMLFQIKMGMVDRGASVSWVSQASGPGPMSWASEPMAPDDRPMAPDDRPMAPDDRPMAPDDRPMAPDDRPMAPDDRRT